jgi:outer membrane protein
MRFLYIAILFLSISPAYAQSTMCDAESPSLLNFNCDRKTTWTLGVGVETEYGSKADGSKEKIFEAEPGAVVNVNLGDWNMTFFNGQELGIRSFPANWINFMLGVRLEPGREVEDDPVLLRGQGDSDDKIMGRAEFRINLYKNWNAWTGVTSLIGDSEIGSLHILFLGYSFKNIGAFDLDIYAFQRWATSAFINKDFGVDATQSINSGNAFYQATSGSQSWGAAAIGRYYLTEAFTVLIEAGYDRYASRLQRSPIIQKGQNYEYEIGATLLYLF